MKKNTLLFFLCLIHLSYTQTVVYDAIHNYINFGSQCTDLYFINPIVAGHQNNVTISYHLNITHAQNHTNSLGQFYQTSTSPETLYARVTHNSTGDYATAVITIITPTPTGPPTGITPCNFSICDVDNNGSETVHLDRLMCDSNSIVNDTNFCNGTTIETTYYLSETDAINKTNSISNNYNISGTINLYIRHENPSTGQYVLQSHLTIDLITCSTDSDSDGIPDAAEDPNGNLRINDEDTDNDGDPNYNDNDDDGDGVLTIDEDHDGDGNPANDNSNANGIADYLEQNITLSVNDFSDNNLFNLYPNPTSNHVYITTKTNATLSIYNISRALVAHPKKLYPNQKNKINTHDLNADIYLLSIKANHQKQIKKLIIH